MANFRSPVRLEEATQLGVVGLWLMLLFGFVGSHLLLCTLQDGFQVFKGAFTIDTVVKLPLEILHGQLSILLQGSCFVVLINYIQLVLMYITLTTIPVGLCCRMAILLVLATAWPPGPLPMAEMKTQSLGSITAGFRRPLRRCTIFFADYRLEPIRNTDISTSRKANVVWNVMRTRGKQCSAFWT